MSKIKLILSIILHAIYGAVYIQLTHFSYDDCGDACTLSYYHHQIGSMTHCNCSGLGHETMICVVCLSRFLSAEPETGTSIPSSCMKGFSLSMALDIAIMGIRFQIFNANGEWCSTEHLLYVFSDKVHWTINYIKQWYIFCIWKTLKHNKTTRRIAIARRQ